MNQIKFFNVDNSKESLLQLHAASTDYFTCDYQEKVCILCLVLSLYDLLGQNIYFCNHLLRARLVHDFGYCEQID